MMNIEEKNLGTIQVVGIKTVTSNANESNPDTAQIPALWQHFFSESIEEQIPYKQDNSQLLGVYTDYDNEHRGVYSIIAGHEVTTIERIPEGMVGISIPRSRYLVFSDEGKVPEVVYALWKSIWDYFNVSTKHHRLYTVDFERYFEGEGSKVEIYIAIA